ncbi:MAG: LysE family translocator [Acidimicrobiia bacterium]
MPPLDSIISFSALAFVLIVAPGPSVMFVVSRAVALGRRAALMTVIGNAVGVYAQVVLVALGLAVIIERSIVIFTTVKLIGAAYLVWLGLQAIRHRRQLGPALEGGSRARPSRSVLRDGFVVGFANPKSIVFFAAILPQFVDAGGAPLSLQFLGMIFVVLALLSDSAWGLAAGAARQWFSRSPKRPERLRVGGGLTMIGLGVQLALTGRNN